MPVPEEEAQLQPIVTRYARFPITPLSESEVIEALLARSAPLTPGEAHLIVTPNMNHLARLQHSPEFGAIYRRADVFLADGWPVVRLANSLGARLGHRTTGSGIVATLAHTNGQGRRVFIVGGSTPESTEIASETFRRSGWLVEAEHAPFGWLDSDANLATLARRVADFNPDVVLLALGSPKQEQVGVRLLDTPGVTSVLLGVGASVDFLAGEVARAPKWMQRMGIEWAHRILTDPSRLLKRYVGDVIPFLQVVRQSHGHRRK